MQGRSDPNRELLDARALCRQLVHDGSVEAFLADHRQALFPDEMFSDLFPSALGRPSVPADVVATVLVLQALEGLSDREAARALADRISWKVACGLSLDDPGFDYSVLAYWRARLRRSAHPQRVFDVVREVVKATGLLRGKQRRALDSTLLDDAVATQDTVTQLIAAVRRVRRDVPEAAKIPLAAHDYDQPGKPLIAWDDAAARSALIDALVKDALAILEAVDQPEEGTEAANALGLLALVAGQDVEQGEDGTWKVADRVTPDRVISVVDPESRHMHKSVHHYRDGYKAHVAVEPETGILTAVGLTPANVADAAVGTELLAGEAPVQVLADSAYGPGDALAALAAAGHRLAIKPKPLPVAVPGGFDRDDFVLDAGAGTLTCPAGQTVTLSPSRSATFGARCRHCRLRQLCTKRKTGRTLYLHPYDAELAEARRAWRDGDFAQDYRRFRPMAERSIAWLVADGWRRCRYRGVAANELGLSLRAAALNLRRLVNLGLTRSRGRWRLQLA